MKSSIISQCISSFDILVVWLIRVYLIPGHTSHQVLSTEERPETKRYQVGQFFFNHSLHFIQAIAISCAEVPTVHWHLCSQFSVVTFGWWHYHPNKYQNKYRNVIADERHILSPLSCSCTLLRSMNSISFRFNIALHHQHCLGQHCYAVCVCSRLYPPYAVCNCLTYICFG